MQDRLANITADGDRLTMLQALRDRLAEEIDNCTNARDIPALALRFTDVLSQIDDIPGARDSSKADEIAARRAARRGSNTPRKARAAKHTG